MEPEKHPAPDDFEDGVEQALEEKLDGVLAADATGMVSAEITTPVILTERPASP
jgi:hypothetical protein